MKNQALAAAIAARLAVQHGEVMVSADLAGELHMSGNALRLVLSRGGDLPRPTPLPGKGHRWLTVDVADWLAERSAGAADANPEDDGRLDVQTHDVAAPRRPGRPRTRAAVVAGGAP